MPRVWGVGNPRGRWAARRNSSVEAVHERVGLEEDTLLFLVQVVFLCGFEEDVGNVAAHAIAIARADSGEIAEAICFVEPLVSHSKKGIVGAVLKRIGSSTARSNRSSASDV